MEINMKYRDENITIAFENSVVKVRDILKKLKLTPETAFVVINGEIRQPHEKVTEEDDIEVVSVISGG
ncbi:MoaD/ThiS family protein [Deferribacteraceae bacterium V6Fe1]|jgi:sulfur carrier protein ThiS|uniref:MoaD/ThiS family protein n=1 Tax=Deferrivibrio essentukiensis TaxID=2880922 RepID=UPI001F60781C|nr:MoaD/ThiS family protein [Deferrivibrio essentukiensis]MCB4203390.1 MoaD/ThiS family protein [Deferrivibrio essentukiensis]UOD35245.1 MoaD/ThiS family protein [Deferribacteraceae bacterium V6Fe1]